MGSGIPPHITMFFGEQKSKRIIGDKAKGSLVTSLLSWRSIWRRTWRYQMTRGQPNS